MADGIRIKIGLDGVDQVRSGAAAAAQSLGQVGTAAGRTGQQAAQLSAQIQDFFVQVQAGGSPLTALIQQGSQLSAVYGGVGNAFRAVTGLLTPAVVAFGSVAAAVGATALAYKQGAAESDAYNRALILTGNIAGTTSGQLKEMAKAQAAVAGTQGKAAEVLTQLAASGQVAANVMGQAARAAIALERAGGPAADETAKKFAELGKSPLQAVVRLNEAENFLTVSVYKQIRALEIQGKTAEAAAVAQKAYADALEGRGGQLEQRMGSLERGWRSVADQAKKAWDAMLDIGRENTLGEKLKQTQARIEKQRDRLTGLQAAPQAGNLALTGGAGASSARGNIGSLLDQRRAQNTTLLRQTEGAINARAEAILTQQTIEQTAKDLEKAAARAQAAYAVLAATIKGQIDQIQSALKQGLSSPIEAIEREGAKRGDLLKAELSLLQQQYATAKDTVGGQAQAIGLLGQISAKRIEIANEEIATQNRVKEAIYATKRAADEFYRQEAEEAERAISDDKLKNRDAFSAQYDANKEYAQSIDDANEAIALQTRLIGANDQARAVAIERLRIQQQEAEKLRAIDRRDGLFSEDREKLKQGVRETAARATAAAEAKAYLEEYQRIYDDLSQGLTNAIIEGGKSARDYLKSLFRSLVLQPILRPFVAPIAGLIASATAPASFAADGSAGSSAFGTAAQGASLFDAGQKIYAGFESGFAGVGATAQSAYAQLFGGGAQSYSANAALIEAQAGSSLYGSAAGTVGANGAGAASTFGTAASAAAGVVAGVYGGRAISGGYGFGNSGNSTVNAGTAIGAVVGSIVPVIGTAVGAAVGGIIGGLVNRLFGRKAPEVEGRSIEGTITGSDFAGSAVTSILEKGGLFRSDKRYNETQAITGDLDKALDEGASQLSALAKKYGDALGLPVDQLAGVTADIKVKITDSADDNAKAIADALGQYADALLGTFADQVEPLRKSGETVAQAIERVGGALLGVNDVLDTLGLTALATSLDGGKAAVALTDLFGGASTFAQASATYYQKFYTEAERADKATQQITEAITGLGLAAPTTREAFRALVEAQDLTTDSGRQAFTTLLGVSDAFDALQTAAGNAAKKLEEVVAERRGLEEELLRLQGNTTELRARERDALDESNRSLYDQIKALEDQKEAADKAAEATKKAAEESAAASARILGAIDSNIGAFLSPEQNRRFQASRISDNLAGVGVNFSADQLLGASKQQIFDFAKSFIELAGVSADAKVAVIEAAGALGQLVDAAENAARQEAIGALQAKIDEINKTFGDLSVIDDVETLSQAFSRNRDELQRLETGFGELMGTIGRSVQDTLRDLIQKQQALQSFRSGLGESIESARLRTLGPNERIASLRASEAVLFGQLGSAADPVAIAQKLQGVILQRIREEAALRQESADAALALQRQARDSQIQSLRDQISGFERLRKLALDIGQFTGSLRFSDLSPLAYGDQLGSARSLFESTLEKARGGDQFAQGNLTGNARAYLEEARAYFASSADYAAIFAQVTGALDSLGGTATADQSLTTLQAQLTALEALQESARVQVDTSAEELEALTRLDASTAAVLVGIDAQVEAQKVLAQAQIDELKTVVEQQRAQIAQQAEIARQLLEELKTLNATTTRGVSNSDLEGARAGSDVGAGW